MSSVPAKVDRHLTTPFLLKVFYKVNCFHRLEDFRANSQPSSFVEVYTWKDCTLTELATLLLSALPSLAESATKCSFRLIYADTRIKRFTLQDIGHVNLPIPTNNVAPGKSLDDVRFVVGDWIDVAVTTSNSSGVGGGGGSGHRGSIGRENGMRNRGGGGGGSGGGGARLPAGEWRRGEKVEDDGAPPERIRNGGGGRGGGRFGSGGGRRGAW